MAKTILLCIASFFAVTGLQAQYRVTVTHPDTVGVNTYQFFAVDCFIPTSNELPGGVSIAASLKYNYGTQDYSLVFCRSLNGGQTWTEQNPGLALTKNTDKYTIYKVQQVDAQHAVAIGIIGVDKLSPTMILRTSNGGTTWDIQIDSLLTDYTTEHPSIHFSDTLSGMAVFRDQRIFTPHDGGTHWTLAPFRPKGGIYELYDLHADGGSTFRARCGLIGNVVLYHTADDWQTVDSTYIINDVNNLAWVNSTQYYGSDTVVVEATNYSQAISYYIPFFFVSGDGGSTWREFHFPDTVQSALSTSSISNMNSSTTFIGGTFGVNQNFRNVLVSTDHGSSWQVDTLIADPQDAQYSWLSWAGAMNSISPVGNGSAIAAYGSQQDHMSYLVRLTKIEASVAEPAVPTASLAAYPNPASGMLRVSVLANGSKVFDLLGREYDCPRSEDQLDISQLPPGVYCLRLSNGASGRFVVAR